MRRFPAQRGNPFLERFVTWSVPLHALSDGSLRAKPSRGSRVCPSPVPLWDWCSCTFVPAGVGVLAYVDILKQEVVPVLAAVLGGTIITLAVTGVAAAVLTRATAPRPQHRPLELSDGIA